MVVRLTVGRNGTCLCGSGRSTNAATADGLVGIEGGAQTAPPAAAAKREANGA